MEGRGRREEKENGGKETEKGRGESWEVWGLEEEHVSLTQSLAHMQGPVRLTQSSGYSE